VDLVLEARHLLAAAYCRGSADFKRVVAAVKAAAGRDVYFRWLGRSLIELADLLADPAPLSFLLPGAHTIQEWESVIVPIFCENVSPICNSPVSALPIRTTGPRTYIAARGGEGIAKVNGHNVNGYLVLETNEVTTVECGPGPWRFVIADCPSVLDVVARELSDWCPRHSHQLAGLKGLLTPEIFATLPLSSRFIYETAVFVHALLRREAPGLPPVAAHFVDANVGPPVYFSWAACQAIADHTVVSHVRIDFLRQHEEEVVAELDAERIFLESGAWLSEDRISTLRTHVLSVIHFSAPAKETEWIREIVTALLPVPLLLFSEVLAGDVSVLQFSVERIDVLCVDVPELFEPASTDRMLVVGTFGNKDALRRRLIECLQRYHDSRDTREAET
jgi:hypothetical protein